MWNEGDARHELRDHEVAMGRTSGSSEVVVMDERMLEAAARTQPALTNINVTKSSRLHIGPKFVSVTQNVDNTEVVKVENPVDDELGGGEHVRLLATNRGESGMRLTLWERYRLRLTVLGHILGLELVSPQNAKRLRCSIAVFVCWAFVVVSALTFFIFYFALAKQEKRLDLDIHEKWYLRRGDWQAMPDYGIELLELPVPNVLIGHSAMDQCKDKYSCIKDVLEIQRDHQRRGWKDIGPNFLVGVNGMVFEGRGANVVGVMVKSWNLNGISVMFLGDYQTAETSEVQFHNVKILLKELVDKEVLRPDYVVYGHCQVTGSIISPGKNIMDELHNFEHWNPVNKTAYLPLPKYLWDIAKSTTRAERLLCAAAMIALFACIMLVVYFTAIAKKASEEIHDPAPHEWFIDRDMWLAPPFDKDQEKTDPYDPLRLVIIMHTVSSECTRFINCAAELRNLQGYYAKTYGYDLPYNFVIGNDGRVYEIRGWNVVGAHTRGYNRCSLGLAFIGDYREGLPSYSKVTPLQLERAQMLLKKGIELGHLHPSYHVVGARDLQATASPGANLYEAVKKWPQFDHENMYHGKSCNDILNMYQNQTEPVELTSTLRTMSKEEGGKI
ncbi:unnamed protein product [Chrysodeixis includens]|uniref:Uncharacterized protein n=1 Tax=Chrysodeixis includens TaxID=689277 RepID=A0A9N8KT47_CHRIL|nr:unnamed protein product [Chrysodeixis includens]